jgi:hypothetical protein
MSLERCQSVIVAKFVSVVQRFFAEARCWPEGSKLYVAEHAAWRLAREVARALLEAWVAGHHGGHRGPRVVDEAGVERPFKQYLTKSVETLLGAIEVSSAQYYAKASEPKSVFPFREELGLPPGGYSRALEEVVALACSEGVYRKALWLVNRLTGAQVSVHKAEEIVARWGEEAKGRVKAEVARPQTPRERIAASRTLKGRRQCVTMDGTKVQTTEGWRDVKLMASYAFDAEGHKVGAASHAGTLHYQEDLSDLLWHLMERTDASRAEELAWLGDGAQWIWVQQQTVAPHAVAIVDFYHPADRLWKVGRALYEEGRAARRWSKKCIKNLYKGKITALLDELATHQAARGHPPGGCAEDDPRQVLADAHRYFTNNASRMHYDEYRAKGYPIASGVVESSCRHIVGLRMKRTATMKWTEAHAEAMVQLRCLTAGGEWDRFWAFDDLWEHIRTLAA